MKNMGKTINKNCFFDFIKNKTEDIKNKIKKNDLYFGMLKK